MNKYLEKLGYDLRPHQQKAIDQLNKNNSIILHHSTGSGKTLTFLHAIKSKLDENPDHKAIVVAPSSLITNVHKTMDEHNIDIDPKRLKMYSYDKAVRSPELLNTHWPIAVVDEAHNLRNPEAKRTQYIRKLLRNSDQRVLSTATVNYNDPKDISTLVNIASGDRTLPEDKKEFEKRFIQKDKKKPTLMARLTGSEPEEVQSVKNKAALSKILNRYINRYNTRNDPKAQPYFPHQEEHVIESEMSPEQAKHYRYVEGSIPPLLRFKMHFNIPMDKKEKKDLNAFATGVRQASNSYAHLSKDEVESTPKIKNAVSSLAERYHNDPNYRGLVYSNYISAGLHPYSQELSKLGIPHNVYTGALKPREKDQMVNDYNSGRTPVLLVSSSGAEGLDLKGTKQVQVLEPHFNPSKIKQVIGRANRYMSHSHLPASERHVDIEYHHSVFPKRRFSKTPFSIDKYLYNNSGTKQDVFDQISGLTNNDVTGDSQNVVNKQPVIEENMPPHPFIGSKTRERMNNAANKQLR